MAMPSRGFLLFTEQVGILLFSLNGVNRCGIFIIDEGISGIDQVAELGIVQSLAAEGLAGRVDILTADLEEAVLLAQSGEPLQLFGGIPGGHIGDGIKAVFLNNLNKYI